MKTSRHTAPPQATNRRLYRFAAIPSLFATFGDARPQKNHLASADRAPPHRSFSRPATFACAWSLLAPPPKHHSLPQQARRSRAFCKRKRAHPVLSCRSVFGEFCIVSHETSAFSMFSTYPILLFFCPILVAFLRDFGRKHRFCLFFSLATDLRLSSSRGSGNAGHDRSRKTRPATDRRATPEDERKMRGAGEGKGGGQPARDRPGKKNRHGQRLSI